MVGAFFINPNATVWGPLARLKEASGLVQAAGVFAIALTLGSLAYVAHRAAIYPLIHRWVLIVLCVCGVYPSDAWLLFPWRPTQLELQLTRAG